ncbi:hypothetical protein KII92_04335 [Leuconostoc gelidum subsp. gasicomitatum]|uniref:hypothetical protein n=1 Tax=Leuconostoc gasicomitatum TaxID=115778 RepID=UPI001CC723E0|nr:hypothetical protein [Leuconostoc gasicomitatum]MBZ5944179.1 hypothetical protein [Leuconostoc gasicomitatum]MBZ5997281.1 hypothetical protein [Leuconostoc gasicomitatum]
MVNNDYIQCIVCGEIINFRVQASDMNIPILINCPVCTSQIRGNFQSMKLKNLVNAKTINLSDTKMIDKAWSFELSAELPTRKVIKKEFTGDNESVINFELSPFMKWSMLMGSDARKSLQGSMRLMQFIDSGKWHLLISLLRIINNNKFKYALPVINRELPKSLSAYKSVSDEISGISAIHQMLMTDSGINIVIGSNALREYTELGNTIITLFKSHKITEDNIRDFDISRFNTEFLTLMDSLSVLFPKLLPILTLRAASKIDKTPDDLNAITTVDAESLNDMYAKTYEFILRHLNVIYLLNNLSSRGNTKKFAKGKTEEEFNKYIGFNKVQTFLIQSERFSKPIRSINNKIRNAIQHYDYVINYNDQTIYYHDLNKDSSLTYIQLGNMVIENVSVIFYLNELIYNLDRIQRSFALPNDFKNTKFTLK